MSAVLIEAIHSLGGQQHLWRPVGDQAHGGLWYVRHEHQYVFFRQLSGGVIGVITILHRNRDLPARLKEDNKLSKARRISDRIRKVSAFPPIQSLMTHRENFPSSRVLVKHEVEFADE